MSPFLWFLFGGFVGGFIGMVVMSVMYVVREVDDESLREMDILEQKERAESKVNAK